MRETKINFRHERKELEARGTGWWMGMNGVRRKQFDNFSGDYVIPRGATVLIPPFKVHRQDEIYPNSAEFNPDNFLPENMQNRHYYSYIPFSAGPRSCVGRKYAMLKLKVLLSTVLRNYKILSDLPDRDFRLQADIILKRTDGFRIRIEPRISNKKP